MTRARTDPPIAAGEPAIKAADPRTAASAGGGVRSNLLERLRARWKAAGPAPQAPAPGASTVAPGGILPLTWPRDEGTKGTVVAELGGRRVHLDTVEGGAKLPADAPTGRARLWSVAAGRATACGEVWIQAAAPVTVLESRRDQDGSLHLRLEGWTGAGRLLLGGRRWRGEPAADGWVEFPTKGVTGRLAEISVSGLPRVRIVLPPQPDEGRVPAGPRAGDPPTAEAAAEGAADAGTGAS